MKLVKKLISIVAAASMAVSAFAAMSVYADGATLTGTATVSDDKSTVSVTLAYSGAEAKMKAAGFEMAIDDTKFDISGLTACEYDLSTMIDEGYATSDLTANRLAYMMGNYASGKLIMAFSSGSTLASKTLQAEEANFMTFILPIKDASVLTEGYEFTLTACTLGTNFQQAEGTLTVTSAKIEGQTATATPVVTEAPTAEPTAEPTATPTVDPAAATVSELQESDADDKNAANLDYAKAIYKSFAGSELVGKRVAWTINGKTAAFDYAIADVDGDVVVGLVIMDTVADALNAITAATAAIVD